MKFTEDQIKKLENLCKRRTDGYKEFAELYRADDEVKARFISKQLDYIEDEILSIVEEAFTQQ